MPQSYSPIPQPRTYPLVGNLLQFDRNNPVQSFMAWAREHGPIYQVEFPTRRLVVVSSAAIVEELCDESRFDKKIHTPIRHVRAFAGDGLFTAYTHEPNWSKAHNILLPNFSLQAMRNYFPMMLEIAEQLVGKWDKLDAMHEIEVTEDMTRLTLETIGLCGFDYRFNSFANEETHPFVESMERALEEAMQRTQRLPIQDRFMTETHERFDKDVAFLNETVDRIIQERKREGANAQKKDLLSFMLNGVDKASGEKLDDTNIRYQIITFLIAGHETTSGLLSFALYFLLKNPAVLARAYAEVDQVLGSDLSVKPTSQQVIKLDYLEQILKEALRLWPTAPAFALDPLADEVLAGKYHIVHDGDYYVLVLAPMLHRDKEVWGENVELFDPDRFSPEQEAKRSPHAFKPFGNGQRACIGRQFAMQEALLVLGMLLQRYQFIDHTNYELKIKETLTLKPDNFRIRIRPRRPEDRILATPTQAIAPAVAPVTAEPSTPAAPATIATTASHGTSLLVLFGSNMGTAEELANQLAATGEANGYRPTVAPLDEYVEKLPSTGAVIIVTSSYNGKPPDNAVKFYQWLTTAQPDATTWGTLKYAVFGCGNRDWATTFQAVPRIIDERLAALGAQRLVPHGEGDARDDFFGDFQRWSTPLWGDFAKAFGLDANTTVTQSARGPLYAVELVNEKLPNPFIAAFNARSMVVIENRELQTHDGPTPSDRSTRHIEIALPEGVRYQTGDHLGVITRNPRDLVARIARRFQYAESTILRIKQQGIGKSNLPLDKAISVYDLLTDYVELQEVATQAQIQLLAEHTPCPPEAMKLRAWAGEDEASRARYRSDILAQRRSVLDLLEEFMACELPFHLYLEMLPALRPRYYSISSSPRAQERICSITVAVVDGPARSGRGHYHGVCSTYLAASKKGHSIYAFVRDPQSAFQLPRNPQTPLIMVGPGTGFAPFRGFLQELAALQSAGETLGRALLFYGCRHCDQDYIYRQEVEAYAAQGVVELHTAFSRLDPDRKVYVQDRITEQKAAVWELLEAGATFFVCGDAAKMEPDVRAALKRIYQEQRGGDEAAAQSWLDKLIADQRYVVDVWAAT